LGREEESRAEEGGERQMTAQLPQLLYMLDEDLYRLGNSTSPKLHNVRPEDVDTYERNGIMVIRASGKGYRSFRERVCGALKEWPPVMFGSFRPILRCPAAWRSTPIWTLL
jgi:hypothetical protein